MLVKKKNRKSTGAKDAFKQTMQQDLLGFLNFCERLLMPWAGVSYMREAVEDSQDVKMLLGIVSRELQSVDPEDNSDWKAVVNLAVCFRNSSSASSTNSIAGLPKFACMKTTAVHPFHVG
jgi:hypothetical protein